jgi:hypothetical protein
MQHLSATSLVGVVTIDGIQSHAISKQGLHKPCTQQNPQHTLTWSC